MATARRLKSGSYRVQVFKGYKYIDGKKQRVYESFTAPTKRAAELLAAQWALTREDRPEDVTVQDGVEAYIQSRTGVLSPMTIRGYKTCQVRMTEINLLRMRDVKTKDIQPWIARLSQKYSAKTVKNTYGLLTAAIDYNCPNTTKDLKVVLPKREKKPKVFPSDRELQTVFNYARENDETLWIALMLARYYSLRRSEICALDADDLKGNVLYIHKAMIPDVTEGWVLKQRPKTFLSNRYLCVEQPLLGVLQKKVGKYVDITPNALSDRVRDVVAKLKVTPFSLHTLRHMFASNAALAGIPDFYTAQIGGWRPGSSVLKEVYQDVQADELRKQMEKLNKLMQAEINKEPENPQSG